MTLHNAETRVSFSRILLAGWPRRVSSHRPATFADSQTQLCVSTRSVAQARCPRYLAGCRIFYRRYFLKLFNDLAIGRALQHLSPLNIPWRLPSEVSRNSPVSPQALPDALVHLTARSNEKERLVNKDPTSVIISPKLHIRGSTATPRKGGNLPAKAQRI